jgi:hypothetical protein
LNIDESELFAQLPASRVIEALVRFQTSTRREPKLAIQRFMLGMQ